MKPDNRTHNERVAAMREYWREVTLNYTIPPPTAIYIGKDVVYNNNVEREKKILDNRAGK
jgi:hypothetical protein